MHFLLNERQLFGHQTPQTNPMATMVRTANEQLGGMPHHGMVVKQYTMHGILHGASDD
jgi:hypothetical protein